jgi:hypothetical protein
LLSSCSTSESDDTISLKGNAVSPLAAANATDAAAADAAAAAAAAAALSCRALRAFSRLRRSFLRRSGSFSHSASPASRSRSSHTYKRSPSSCNTCREHALLRVTVRRANMSVRNARRRVWLRSLQVPPDGKAAEARWS